jgi:hypothetical protein
MKKLYIFLAAVLLTANIFGQAPEKMSYQAVIRDSGDNLVSNQRVGMRISILKGSTPVYVETQTPTTNVNGLVTLEIGATGTGTVVSGDFSIIDWSAGPYFIQTETDPTGGESYSITGTSQLLSVPYALHAKVATTADNGIPTGGTEGQVLTIVNGVPEWASVPSAITVTYYLDGDGDSYGDINEKLIILEGSSVPPSYVDNVTDCDDNDASINPDTVWYIGVDTDNDSFLGSVTQKVQCESPGIGYTLTSPTITDCNDSDPSINPTTFWYLDADSDNYAISITVQCTSPGAGYTTTVLPLGDCNDNVASINPGVIEDLTNEIDDDCDGITDSLPKIGDLREGGIVFWVDGNGGGKVCARSDAVVFNAPYTLYTLTWSGAKEYCTELELTYNNILYKDWYLPSKNELNLMWKNLADSDGDGINFGPDWIGNLGGFSINSYWSSTEGGDYSNIHGEFSKAWIQSFGNGSQSLGAKWIVAGIAGTEYQSHTVRAVRAF